MSAHGRNPDNSDTSLTKLARNGKDALSSRPGRNGQSRGMLAGGEADLEREENSARGLSGYLHAFRRRWLLAVTLGLLGGGTAAAAAWLCAPMVFTAFATIRIASEMRKSPLQSDEGPSNFDVYKGTQMQLITSDFVI